MTVDTQIEDTQIENHISTEERRKRQSVFAKKPKIVLVKFLAMGGKSRPWVHMLNALPTKKRDETKIAMLQYGEAHVRDMDPHGYRKTHVDTGYNIIPKMSGTRVSDLITQLLNAGLLYTGGHKFRKTDKLGWIYTLEFSKDGKQIPYPQGIRRIMNLRYNNCTIWGNLKYELEGEGQGQYRLDTINLAKGLESNESASDLRVEGNTYRMV